jgi:hypothetical protein
MGVGNGDVVMCYDVSIMVIYVLLMRNNNLVIACGESPRLWGLGVMDCNIFKNIL